MRSGGGVNGRDKGEMGGGGLSESYDPDVK